MSFTQAVKTVLSKYATFDGRARRSEFWNFILFIFIVDAVIGVLGWIIGQRVGDFLLDIVALALLLPSLAVEVRRLHDIGKSGWWMLIALIPLVGAILLIVWETQDGQPGDNEYGPNPKIEAARAEFAQHHDSSEQP